MAGFGFDPFDQFDDQVYKDLFARRSEISHQMYFLPERPFSMKIIADIMKSFRYFLDTMEIMCSFFIPGRRIRTHP